MGHSPPEHQGRSTRGVVILLASIHNLMGELQEVRGTGLGGSGAGRWCWG